MKYKIYPALHEDIQAGWVWVGSRPHSRRCVVRIINPENRHRVFCEALEIDPNFLLRYNQSPRSSIDEPAHSIVMSEWYRDRLGNLPKQTEIELELVLADNAWASLRACLQHPQIVVRLATWLAIISVMLGLIGLLFGVLSLFGAQCLK